MRCWSPFPESLLRLPRRMNSYRESKPKELSGVCRPVSGQILASSHPSLLPLKIIVITVIIY